MTTKLTTSEIFSWYNKARRVSGWDKGRSNRALGLLLQKDQSWREKYNTTTTTCGCPDHAKTHLVCKHMRAIMIETRIIQNRPTTPAPASINVVELALANAKSQWHRGETVHLGGGAFLKAGEGVVYLNRPNVKPERIFFLNPGSWEWEVSRSFK